MATMSPLPSVDGLNIKESLVTADINLISEGTLALACMTRVHLYAPFLFACLGMTTHTLEQQIGEQCDSSGVNNPKTFHPDCIPIFASVR